MKRKILGLVVAIAAMSLAFGAFASGAPKPGQGSDKNTSTTTTSTTTTTAPTTTSTSTNGNPAPKPTTPTNTAGSPPSTTNPINNGGNTPNCGNSCDESHNPTDYEKPCTPVPGNGCHTLPDTPCERGHGGTEIGNKHCATPHLAIVKEQKLLSQPASAFTTDGIFAPLNSSDLHYRITVTNLSSVAYHLTATDPNCSGAAASGLSPSGSQALAALGTVVYTCNIDVIAGIGTPVAIPANATPGGGPYMYTNTVTVNAVPDAGGAAQILTSSVTAMVN